MILFKTTHNSIWKFYTSCLPKHFKSRDLAVVEMTNAHQTCASPFLWNCLWKAAVYQQPDFPGPPPLPVECGQKGVSLLDQPFPYSLSLFTVLPMLIDPVNNVSKVLLTKAQPWHFGKGSEYRDCYEFLKSTVTFRMPLFLM